MKFWKIDNRIFNLGKIRYVISIKTPSKICPNEGKYLVKIFHGNEDITEYSFEDKKSQNEFYQELINSFSKDEIKEIKYGN